MCAMRDERESGAGDEVAYRSRHDDLVGTTDAHHPGGDVNGDAADVIAAQLDLPGVNAGAGAQPDRTQFVAHRRCASDGAPRPVEEGDDSVASRLHQPPLALGDA